MLDHFNGELKNWDLHLKVNFWWIAYKTQIKKYNKYKYEKWLLLMTWIKSHYTLTLLKTVWYQYGNVILNGDILLGADVVFRVINIFYNYGIKDDGRTMKLEDDLLMKVSI